MVPRSYHKHHIKTVLILAKLPHMILRKIILLTLCISTWVQVDGQKVFKLSIDTELDLHKNFGAINTYDEITDGYSPTSLRKAIGLSLAYHNLGIRIRRFDFDLQSDGFLQPIELLRASYDQFARPFSGFGGSYRSYGYEFDGHSIGIFKVFQTKYFDLEIFADYGNYQVKPRGGVNENLLFSFRYNTEEDFASRHWAVYNGGHFWSGGANVVKNIWKGIHLFAGLSYRHGAFEYIYRETIRDDLFPENNLNAENIFKKKFESIGFLAGIKYVFILS